MSVKKLIANFQGRTEFPILVDEVTAWLLANGYKDEIKFYPVEMNEDILKGIICQYVISNPTGVYTDPKHVAEITYCKTLNPCWTRFVCCKELMHLMDDQTARTYTADQIGKLTLNLTSPAGMGGTALPADLLAEQNAIIKALSVLVPLGIIPKLHEQYKAGLKNAYDIALMLRIPEYYVKLLFSTEYQEMAAILVS